MANAAAWIRHISQITGDYMDVDVRHDLASSAAGVESDIVAVGRGRKPDVEQSLDLLHQGH